MSLKDSLDGCERILNDEFKDYPESALYMIGAVDEVKQQATSGKPGANDASKLTSKTETHEDVKPAVTPEPNPKPVVKPQPETENAVDTHES